MQRHVRLTISVVSFCSKKEVQGFHPFLPDSLLYASYQLYLWRQRWALPAAAERSQIWLAAVYKILRQRTLKSATAQRVEMVKTIVLCFWVGEICIRVMSGFTSNLKVSVLPGAAFIDNYFMGIFPMHRKIGLSNSPAVPIFRMHETELNEAQEL